MLFFPPPLVVADDAGAGAEAEAEAGAAAALAVLALVSALVDLLLLALLLAVPAASPYGSNPSTAPLARAATPWPMTSSLVTDADEGAVAAGAPPPAAPAV